MAFNNVGPVFIWGSSRLRLKLTHGYGEDHGAQWIMADPSDWGALGVTDFAKRRDPVFHFDGSERTWWVTYEFTVVNYQSYAQYFTVQGGGNT